MTKDLKIFPYCQILFGATKNNIILKRLLSKKKIK